MDRLDLVVFGATGFTGKHTVKELVNNLRDSPDLSNVTWGIAGRSVSKLNDLISELEEIGATKTSVSVLKCNIQKDDIREVTRKAKVIINCTGPNTILSEPIVKACLETKTHYVDISAELFHMLHLYRTYNQAAQEANVLVVPACGFAVVPIEAGLSYLQKNFKGTLIAVEGHIETILPKRAYLPGTCVIHYGTWESLVHELVNRKEYQRLKAATFPQNLYKSEAPRGFKKSFFHWKRGKVWFPYPGPDKDVNKMSQRYLYEKMGKTPYRCNLYTSTPLFIHLFLIIPVIFLYYFLCYFKCFRKVLWNYPRLVTLGYVSHKGPTEKTANETKFRMRLEGKGVGDDSTEKSLTVQVSVVDPGYKTTSTAVVVSALTILTESANMPKGGVLGVGAAFRETKIEERLMKSKYLEYEILK